MTNKIPKLHHSFFFGWLMLTFILVSCNDKKDKEKTITTDTTVVSPLIDTMKKDTMMMDTASQRPVKTPD